jgi:superfamily II DNA or RNA helicase
MKFNPHNYQTYAINRIMNQLCVGLFLDMGMGKTICTLTAATKLLEGCEIKKVSDCSA